MVTQSRKYPLLIILFAVLKLSASLHNSSSDVCLPGDQEECPTWFSCSDQHQCECGHYTHGIIHCNNTLQTSGVLSCHCVTYDSNENATVAGSCFTNCGMSLVEDISYIDLPRSVSTLNEFMCGYLRRTGPLCGRCKKRHSPLAYSFNIACVECPNGHKNWWKFILVAFFPLTVFYLFVLTFKLNVTSSSLHAFVFYSQILSTPMHLRVFLSFLNHNDYTTTLKAAKVIGSLYGVWNLDFFRTLLPDICLNTTPLQTLALDYAIALYPLLLIIISWTLIEMHDHGYRCMVRMWKPFRIIFNLFQRNWDIRTSVLDAFATFFLLSYVKLLGVSFDILFPTRLYRMDSDNFTLALYYDGSVKYFGNEHLPFAVLALVVLTFFVMIPTMVLVLYPFRWFQKFLNCFPIRWQILHTFVDSFQGCYKDGTEPGTRDCRWFAALFLIVRILIFVIYVFVQNAVYYPLGSLLFILLILLLVVCQPYKPRVAHYMKINVSVLMLLLLGCVMVSGTAMSIEKAKDLTKFMEVASTTVSVIPLLYITYSAIHWLFSHRKWGKEFVQRFKAWKQGYEWWPLQQGTDMEPFPYRLQQEILN